MHRHRLLRAAGGGILDGLSLIKNEGPKPDLGERRADNLLLQKSITHDQEVHRFEPLNDLFTITGEGLKP